MNTPNTENKSYFNTRSEWSNPDLSSQAGSTIDSLKISSLKKSGGSDSGTSKQKFNFFFIKIFEIANSCNCS